ncbi:hypothetical protein QBC36DRAFT_307269 [Triangularia setosa]|uniref:Uncharacterized protein n=1 Tax=Triangularia setosa TaxID=2587417 RepID=A0AAN6WEP8_9PEZI|nr:hypothetical protein QBC36DRAFT_307269 [Podospora setosa]
MDHPFSLHPGLIPTKPANPRQACTASTCRAQPVRAGLRKGQFAVPPSRPHQAQRPPLARNATIIYLPTLPPVSLFFPPLLTILTLRFFTITRRLTSSPRPDRIPRQSPTTRLEHTPAGTAIATGHNTTYTAQHKVIATTGT